jgi:hypothetical protein
MLLALDTGPQPNPFLLVTGVVIVMMGVGVWRILPEFWRGGPVYQRTKRLVDFYGEPMATSLLSTLPIDSVFLVVGGVLGLLLMVGEANFAGLRSTVDTANYLIMPAFMLVLVLFFAVLLFGQPKLIIPPHLRNHRGVVPELILAAYRRISSPKPKDGKRRRP